MGDVYRFRPHQVLGPDALRFAVEVFEDALEEIDANCELGRYEARQLLAHSIIENVMAGERDREHLLSDAMKALRDGGAPGARTSGALSWGGP